MRRAIPWKTPVEPTRYSCGICAASIEPGREGFSSAGWRHFKLSTDGPFFFLCSASCEKSARADGKLPKGKRGFL